MSKLDANQMEFPSLDFPGRKVLYAFECAEQLGCHVDHIHDLITEGKIKAINIAGGNNLSDRRCIRIPIESWRQFIAESTI